MATYNICESISETVYHWLQMENLFPYATVAVFIKSNNVNYEELSGEIKYQNQWLVEAEKGEDYVIYGNDIIHCVLITTNQVFFERWSSPDSEKQLQIIL